MSQDRLAMIYRRGIEAYNRGDYDAAVEIFDPGIEWEVDSRLAPDPMTYYGRDGVKQFWESWAEAFSGMVLEIEECRSVAPRRVFAITRARGLGTGSGVSVASRRFGQLADFHGDRVVRVRVYGDVQHALEAVGLSE
jgi:ketosteroid isomerase-like protein